MSFGTSACTFAKGAIKGVQFKASSSGCFDRATGNVWACPLWTTPNQWIPPQGHSGEVDFLERCGNEGGTGFALNFGNNGDAGAGQTSFNIPELETARMFYYRFNSPLLTNDDSVEGWHCPINSDPIKSGTLQCQLIGKNEGYYNRTHHSEA